jgi:hypothetical protein
VDAPDNRGVFIKSEKKSKKSRVAPREKILAPLILRFELVPKSRIYMALKQKGVKNDVFEIKV